MRQSEAGVELQSFTNRRFSVARLARRSQGAAVIEMGTSVPRLERRRPRQGLEGGPGLVHFHKHNSEIQMSLKQARLDLEGLAIGLGSFFVFVQLWVRVGQGEPDRRRARLDLGDRCQSARWPS